MTPLKRLSTDHYLGDEVFEDTWPDGLTRLNHFLKSMEMRAYCDILKADKLKKTAKAKP